MISTRWDSVDPSEWKDRISIIAKFIPGCSVVLDIGAGSCDLEARLPGGCSYIPLDLIDRGRETFVCDLNAESLPLFPEADVAICSGVLEYVHDVRRLFSHLPQSIQLVIASYAISDLRYNDRGKNGWINSLSRADVIRAFTNAGFNQVKIACSWSSQDIFLARRGMGAE